MRNKNGCLIACNLIEPCVDLCLCHGVKRRSRLVKDDEGRVLIERAGDCYLLRLAAGGLHAILGQILVEHGVKSPFHYSKTFAEAGVNQGLFRPVPVIFHTA